MVKEKLPVKDLFMGAVAMNMETFERIDLTECVDNEGLLTWQAPKVNGSFCHFSWNTMWILVWIIWIKKP